MFLNSFDGDGSHNLWYIATRPCNERQRPSFVYLSTTVFKQSSQCDESTIYQKEGGKRGSERYLWTLFSGNLREPRHYIIFFSNCWKTLPVWNNNNDGKGKKKVLRTVGVIITAWCAFTGHHLFFFSNFYFVFDALQSFPIAGVRLQWSSGIYRFVKENNKDNVQENISLFRQWKIGIYIYFLLI